MRLIGLAVILALGLMFTPLLTDGAQEAWKVYRVGVLSAAPREAFTSPQTALEAAFRELGYVQGKNIALEYRFAGGQFDRLPQFATELVQLPVDVIAAGTNPAIAAAKAATTQIPIVMAAATDPVRAGLVAGIARPGGNITGVTVDAAPETILGKQLAVLKEAVPNLSRVGVLWNPDVPAYRSYFESTQAAARQLSLGLYSGEVQNATMIEPTIASARRDAAGALLVLVDTLTFSQRKKIIDLGLNLGMPTTAYLKEFAEAGALVTYGVDLTERYRRAAYYVDRIVKGAKPADLPIEQPTKFELVINRKTAKALGLTIPQSLLLQADQVIE